MTAKTTRNKTALLFFLALLFLLLHPHTSFADGVRIDETVQATGEVGKIGQYGDSTNVNAFNAFALQVNGINGSGVSTAPTAWDVRLEIALKCDTADDVEWFEIGTHDQTSDTNNDIKYFTSTLAVCFRVRVEALTLGTATDLEVTVVAKDND